MTGADRRKRMSADIASRTGRASCSPSVNGSGVSRKGQSHCHRTQIVEGERPPRSLWLARWPIEPIKCGSERRDRAAASAQADILQFGEDAGCDRLRHHDDLAEQVR
jgi:hypothetical protein